jgi:hypothetical protein
MRPRKPTVVTKRIQRIAKAKIGRRAYCVFINALFEGSVPSVRDENDMPYIFKTRVEAEREIADLMMTRLQEFMDGERDFEDATITEEYVVEVNVLPDGSIVDADGNHFGSRRSIS